MPRRDKAFADEGTNPQLAALSDLMAARLAARARVVNERAMAAYGPAGDPWHFVRDCVWTHDEASVRQRRYPNLDYAAHLTARWREHSVLAVPKSRRMVVTWLFVALNYWLARFHPGAKIGFMARKEGKSDSEGSAELVRRAKFIHEHLPPIFAPMEADYAHCSFRLPNGSEIIGLGAGPDQARQHTFTSLLCDEFAFWDQAFETWVALKPTIEGGGRITMVSSAMPGIFADLVHDVL